MPAKQRPKENREREERIANEVIVDAYDEGERMSGWHCYLEEGRRSIGWREGMISNCPISLSRTPRFPRGCGPWFPEQGAT